MCPIVEDYAKNKMRMENVQTIENLFRNKCSLDAVLASFVTVPEDIVRKIYDEVHHAKNQ